jgi:hypothetical protein
MADLRTWILMTLLVACVIGLIIWARGTDHHRGQDIGAARALYAHADTVSG